MKSGTICRPLADLRGSMTVAEIDAEIATYTAGIATTTPGILHAFFVDGDGYTEIGAQVGMTRQAVYQRVAGHLQKMGKKISSNRKISVYMPDFEV